jgi:hypothetical protein
MSKRFVAVVALVGAALTMSPVVASADSQGDGHVYAKATSVAGTQSGGSAHADLNFTGQRRLVYNNFVVNDTCPGDAFDVRGRAIAIYRDGSTGHGTWHRDPHATCSGDGWGPVSGLEFTASKDIMRAGVQVCVMRPNASDICAADYRDNPYT